MADAFASSEGFRALPRVVEILRLILDRVPPEDAACVALTCRAFAEAAFAQHGRPLRTWARHFCARASRLAWALEAGGCPRMGRMWLWAVELGDVPVMECVERAFGPSAERCDASGPALCAAAAQRGALDILAWLHARGFAWDKSTMRAACVGGHLDTLAFCVEHGCPVDLLACHAAAAHGHIVTLRWLLAHTECKLYNRTAAEAAKAGEFETLVYLHEVAGCPWDARVCAWAAAAGHLPILTYARERGCPVDASATTAAALHGQLAVCRWLHARGVEFTEHACAAAACLADPRVLAYLRQEVRCPWDREQCLELAQSRAISHRVASWILAHPAEP